MGLTPSVPAERAGYDPARHYLGPLCRWGHDHSGSGQSLRILGDGHCVECCRERPTDKATQAERQRRYLARHGRRPLSEAAKIRKADRQRERAPWANLSEEDRREKARAQYRYKRRRLERDPDFALRERLRDRLSKALKRIGRGLKVIPSRDYGVDYAAIARHLGPCPGDPTEYHVDHRVPLAAFDLSDPDQVRRAFAPDNHQWLPRLENSRKGSRLPEPGVMT